MFDKLFSPSLEKQKAEYEQRFLDNLARYRAGEALQYQVDLSAGY